MLRQVVSANARVLGATLAAARWWTEALAGGAATGLEGRRVEVRCGGRPLRGVVESVRLDRREGRGGARLGLGEVEWDGLRFDAVTATAESVIVDPPPRAALTATGVVLEGRTPLGPLVAWLDRRVIGWRLAVVRGGVVEAVPHGGGVRLELEPAVRNGVLEAEVRGVAWRRVRVRVPAWLRLTRTATLPDLPEGIEVATARRRGTDVELRLTVPAIRRPLG